jgi:hypothetical protein
MSQRINAVWREVFGDLGGCDNSCLIQRPGGMGTNGGCRCSERTIRIALLKAKQEILRLRGICEMCEALQAAKAAAAEGNKRCAELVAQHELETGHMV